ncbi:hypothetical protein EYF80_031407 [Liparis tanakae]|uniref:Uncharacterized protein n=1 Tax=Liparis tanakae TaxID=230148 RepID=A0A4Z2GY02_9TELE|nr:hypothetical protein EYF80_031407 [Liparis tanakae]
MEHEPSPDEKPNEHTAVDSTVTDTRLMVPQSTTVGVSLTLRTLVQPPAPAHSELGHSSTRTWDTLTCMNDCSWMEMEREEESVGLEEGGPAVHGEADVQHSLLHIHEAEDVHILGWEGEHLGQEVHQQLGDSASALGDKTGGSEWAQRIQREGWRLMSAPISQSSERNQDTGRQRDSREGWGLLGVEGSCRLMCRSSGYCTYQEGWNSVTWDEDWLRTSYGEYTRLVNGEQPIGIGVLRKAIGDVAVLA